MIAYLDTNVVLWLYAGMPERISGTAKAVIESHDLFISPIVHLEIQCLYECRKISKTAEQVVSDVQQRFGVKLSQVPLPAIISEAVRLSWTRDLFDRLIVAAAAAQKADLITSDRRIRENYPLCVW